MKTLSPRAARRRPPGATPRRSPAPALLVVVAIFIQLVTPLDFARAARIVEARQGAAGRQPLDVASLDIPALIREVGASERANNKNFADYTYTSKTTERETRGGKIVKERVTISEVYPQYGESVRKVLSRDGVALPAEESEREFRRAVEGFRKAEADAEKRRAESAKRASAPKPTPDPRAIPTFGPSWGYGFRSGFSSGFFVLGLSYFLRAAEFRAPRLERFRERDAIVLDFSPRPGYAPPTGAQNPYASLAGRIWIDVADKQIMRLEARPVAGALKTKEAVAAAAGGEPWVVIEQTRLPDGRWKESLIRLNTTADKSVFNGVERDQTEEMTDFRKFNAQGEGKVDETKPPDES